MNEVSHETYWERERLVQAEGVFEAQTVGLGEVGICLRIARAGRPAAP